MGRHQQEDDCALGHLESYGAIDELMEPFESVHNPMAYKPKEEIIANISETADIVNVIRPLFNFKASE